MSDSKMIWGLMVYLSSNQWGGKNPIDFDENFWNYLLDKCEEGGINTILLDVGDGVVYDSHPELAVKGSWSRERTHQELEKCRARGIEIIPKINFSTHHNFWLGEYRCMQSTKPYYKFCSDIINEIYEIFEHPKYIHLGGDEEEIVCAIQGTDYVVFRKPELYLSDYKFLIDEVKKTGSIAMIWNEPLIYYPDLCTKYINPDDVVVMPCYYWNHYGGDDGPVMTEIDGHYKDKGITREEDLWIRANFRKYILPLMDHGYKYVPTTSIFNQYPDTNTDHVVEYFKNGTPSQDQILGYISAPWEPTKDYTYTAGYCNREFNSRDSFDKSIEAMARAREKYYGK